MLKFLQVIIISFAICSLTAQELDSVLLRTTIDSLTTQSNSQFEKGDYGQSASSRLQAIPHIKQLKNWKELVTEYNYIYYIAFSGDDLHRSEAALDSGMYHSKIHLTDKDPERYYLLANIAYNYYTKADYPNTIEFQEKAIAGFEKLSTPLPNYYNNILTLLTAYRQKGDINVGLDITQTYLNAADTLATDYNWIKSELLNYKAIFHRENREYQEALATLKLAEEENESVNNTYYKDLIGFEILQSFAFTHSKNNNSTQAIKYCKRANAMYLKKNNSLPYEFYLNLGDMYREGEEYQNAISTYKDGLKLFSEKQIKNKKYDALFNFNIGVCYFKLNQIDSAKHYKNAAENALDIKLDQKLERISDYNKSSSFNLNSIKMLSWFAELENHQAKTSADLDQKEKAIIRYQQAFNGSKYLQRELLSNSSKHLLNKNIQEHYSNYVKLLLDKNNIRQSDTSFNQIFHIIEDYKSRLLKEDLHEKTVLAQSKIPKGLLEEERKYTTQINDLKTKVHKHKPQEGDNRNIKQNWETKVTELTREYAGFQKTLEKDYPEYYKRKYTLSKADLNALQNQISSMTLYLNYFNTDEEMYCAWISKDDFGVFKVGELQKLNKDINSILSLIKKENPDVNPNVEINRYKELAFGLYSQLIPEEAKAKNKLIISPSSTLHYLPFETLLEMPSKENLSFKGLSYLLKTHIIEYAFSSELWLESKSIDKESIVKEVVVASFAPFTGESLGSSSRSCNGDITLSDLPATIDEVNGISEYFENTSYLGSNSTVEAFRQSKNKNIIHLATHACLDNEDASFNKLMFAKEDLPLLELESMVLDSDLAILSACNTASGNIKPGEGVINLSKGFRKAGVKSLISSLWSINDRATGHIIQNFYGALNSSGEISSSLQTAKLQYLEKADKRHAHPYYWAGLVFSGDSDVFKHTKPLFGEQNYLLISVILIALLLFFYFRRK